MELIRIKKLAYQVTMNERITSPLAQVGLRAWEYEIDSAGDGVIARPEVEESS